MMRKVLLAAFALACLAGCGGEKGALEEPVRFATFNVYLNRPTQGQLAVDLQKADNLQARKVAEIIQRAAPDVLLLNEFDYDPDREALNLFLENYLAMGWNGAEAAIYPYVFVAPSNTGAPSGHDLDRNGIVETTPGSRDYGGDAFGYGEFPGQYAMALLSKYPIDEANVRTFQKFLWKDMPDAMLPDDPATPTPADWYDAATLADFRLSSKSHWDVPIMIGDRIVHVLASHPTPPGFDGEEDRNGKRNHDELRFWADYITPGKGDYIYDDTESAGGLAPHTRFVILGDLNADPYDGDAVPGAVNQVLTAPTVSATPFPQSKGAAIQASLQGGANLIQKGPPTEDTADFNDDPEKGPGNLHLDYIVFSDFGFRAAGAGVFWPGPNEPFYDLVGPGFPIESSDHRLTWRDLILIDE